MTTGQRAMARAMALQLQGKRKNGRWSYGAIENVESPTSETWKDAMKRAGVVLDETPHVAPTVLDGNVKLDKAYQDAKAIRDGRNTVEARMAELREHAPDLAALVDAGADSDQNLRGIHVLTIFARPLRSRASPGSPAGACSCLVLTPKTRPT